MRIVAHVNLDNDSLVSFLHSQLMKARFQYLSCSAGAHQIYGS